MRSVRHALNPAPRPHAPQRWTFGSHASLLCTPTVASSTCLSAPWVRDDALDFSPFSSPAPLPPDAPRRGRQGRAA